MAFLGPLELVRVAGLRPELLVLVLPLMTKVEARTGKKVYVPEHGGARTHAEQQALYDDPERARLGYPVATPGESRHEFAGALDLHIVDGTDADYRSMAEEAEQLGLVAGYYFFNRDPFHVELLETLAEARARFAQYQKKKLLVLVVAALAALAFLD